MDVNEKSKSIGMNAARSLERVLGTAGGAVIEVLQERVRQHAKWGEQNHPSYAPGSSLGLVDAEIARRACQTAAAAGRCSWTAIAIEEFAEAVDAAAALHEAADREEMHRLLRELRTELVQNAAVFVAWIEAVDRKIEAS